MRKKLTILLLCCLALNGCSALPAEDRSFAVALGVSAGAGEWEVSARIPNYQQSGGYATLSAKGASLQEALAQLDASAPMRMHYGQVRLLAIGRELVESADFIGALRELGNLPDMRLQAQICVTEEDMGGFMDALEPQTGARLSKSLDMLMETRRELGVIPDASLSAILRMGERQCPVLISAEVEGSGKEAKLQLSGGWLVSHEGQARGRLAPGEMQLLTLLHDELRRATVPVGEGTVTLSDGDSRVSLDGNTVLCDVTLRYTHSALTEDGLTRALEADIRAVADKLAAAGCDALGLGGFAIRHYADIPAWHDLGWPEVYPQLEWRITVRLHPAA